jgi:homoserine kinase type II
VATFTTLDETDMARISAAFELGAVRSFRAIAAGTINSNFELHAERGHVFVRINEGKAEPDVAWEARLVAALAGGGVITPPPLIAAEGRPYMQLGDAPRKWVSAFPWREGAHLASEQVTPAHAAGFGAALAQLHLVGLELPTAWRRGSIYDHDHLVARYEHFARIDDSGLVRAILVLGEELAAAEEAAPIRRRATTGIIHGDLFRDNVLWQGDRIAAILDFEQASGGSLAYDLAVCLNDWCWTRAPRPELAAALIHGYEAVRRLSADDRAALPVEIRAAAARFAITRITDVYLARQNNPDKDFRAFLARCEAWRGPALGRIIEAL